MNEKIWHVWYGEDSHNLQHCAVKAHHISFFDNSTIVFYEDGEENLVVAVFRTVVHCTLDGVVDTETPFPKGVVK